MHRRSFLSLAAGIAAAPAFGQSSKGQLVNVDQHGDMDGMQMPPKLAGEDKASDELMAARVEGAGSVVPVLRRGYDALGSGANTRETILTPDAIRRAGGLRLQFTLVMPGDKRGCESDPLIVPNVQTSSGAYDLCVCSSMSNNVWAFDAQNGAPLWMTRLGNPIKGSKQIDGWGINDTLGCFPPERSSGIRSTAWRGSRPTALRKKHHTGFSGSTCETGSNQHHRYS
jgi:hypothetical protein